MRMSENILHPIEWEGDPAMQRMNDPFDYLPDSAVVAASREVVAWLDRMALDEPALGEELRRGKMLGVLIVAAESGQVGYLAAFSGALAGRTCIDGFVPPIYDLNDEASYFRGAESEISGLNRQILDMESSEEYVALRRGYDTVLESVTRETERARREYAEAKRLRAERRLREPEMIPTLQRESQHQRGELRRLEQQLREELEAARSGVEGYKSQIKELKTARARLSNELQTRMFESYIVLNGNGERRSLLSIFEERYHRLPPAGAGECAAPKMLNYALANGYKPLAIGEFWVGESPSGEVREEGHFYGACHGKCLPILSFMLQGVDVAPVVESLARDGMATEKLEKIFEDEAIIAFSKPSGMLSVRGNIDAPSVESYVAEHYPSARMVHRLDQDTSGILLIAKGAEVHRNLQRQFSSHSLSKRYVAIVEGGFEVGERGEISLPMRPDPLDRPRQVVDSECGKSAITTYEVLGKIDESRSLVALYPHTGRTHQLRLHCAHRDGLAAPIEGDRLYGRGVESAPRLALHAESITFSHPISNERVTLCAPLPQSIFEPAQ